MKIATIMDIFDFLEANGIHAEVFSQQAKLWEQSVLVVMPPLPWWAWIRRRWHKEAAARLQKALPVGWCASVFPSWDARDFAYAQECKGGSRCANSGLTFRQLYGSETPVPATREVSVEEIAAQRAAVASGQKELHKIMTDRLQRQGQAADRVRVAFEAIPKVVIPSEDLPWNIANQQELFDPQDILQRNYYEAEIIISADACRQESSQPDTCSDSYQDTSSSEIP